MKMQCCAPFCKTTTDVVSISTRITFHEFPSEVHLRTAWLRALGKQNSHLPYTAMVCSQHFLTDDIYETESGLRKIVTGAIPSTVQVCMICLDTDSKLILMSKHKLEEGYEKLTGHPMYDQGNLKQTLCVQCAQKLINFSRFRDKSLRARALMMDLVDKHELITRRHIKMINRTKHQLKSSMGSTTLGPDHCDLLVLEHHSEDTLTELEETAGHRDVEKMEESDVSMFVDGDMEVIHEHNNVKDSIWDPLKYESITFQCTHCLEEFVHEHEYMQHIMCMHLQNGAGDGECVLRQADPSPSARAAQSTVAPVSAIFAINKENEVHTSIAADAEQIKTQELETNNDKIVTRPADSKLLTNCDLCGKIFKQKSILVNHIRQHAAVRRFTCKICQYKCKCKSYLIKHMLTHTGEKPYNCKLCEFKCTQSGYLKYHMRTHTGEKPYSCQLCEFKCARSGSLKRHRKTHTGEKPYSCELCEFRCAQKVHLKRHIKTHTGEKPYSCGLCEFKCAQKGNLNKHMKTHTGEKPYSCELCEFKCAQSGKLKYHMRTHTGEKPYSCELCEFKCALSYNLNQHMKTHTGEKPYSCDLCEFKCAQNGKLKRHMRTHTGEKPYHCSE